MLKSMIASLMVASMIGAAKGGEVFGDAKRVQDVESSAMAVAREGNRLYVAAETVLAVLDISDPLNPRKLGEIDGVDNRRQIVVRDAMVYLVSRETGMRIIDCTDPAHPRIRARYDSVEFATGIDVAGKVAFLSERIYGVEFVDVSDPDHPAHIAIRKTNESQSNRYRGGYLYSGEWGGALVTVFDAHDMRNIREVCKLELHGFGDGLELDGNYLYCSTGHESRHRDDFKGQEVIGRGRGMDIFSLEDPARPKHVARIDFPRFEPRDEDFWTVRVSEGRKIAFCCDSHNGLFAVDVADPSMPRIMDRFCVPQPGKDWPSGAISSLAVGEGCVYVTSAPGGLFVIPVEGVKPAARPQGKLPENANYREQYPTDESEFFVYKPKKEGQARTVQVRGNTVYAAFGDAGLHVLEATPGKGFRKLAELEGRQVYDCAFCGDKLVTAEGLDGFAVYSLAGGPGVFREEQRRRRIAPRQQVAFWCWAPDDRHVVLTSRYGGKCFYSIDDINSPKPLCQLHGTCQWDKYASDRAIGGWYPNLNAYRAMQWVKMDDKKVSFEFADISFPADQTCGVAGFDDRRFIATFHTSHELTSDGKPNPKGDFFALTDGETRKFSLIPIPPVPGNAPMSGVPRSDGRWVGITKRSVRKAALYDLANPESPVPVKMWQLSGNPDACAFIGGKMLIPAGHQGLLMQR